MGFKNVNGRTAHLTTPLTPFFCVRSVVARPFKVIAMSACRDGRLRQVRDDQVRPARVKLTRAGDLDWLIYGNGIYKWARSSGIASLNRKFCSSKGGSGKFRGNIKTDGAVRNVSRRYFRHRNSQLPRANKSAKTELTFRPLKHLLTETQRNRLRFIPETGGDRFRFGSFGFRDRVFVAPIRKAVKNWRK